ncbi:hypothetical protein CK203_059050 [Vitis vinifera]|uniref:Uncharacterized protein n=1 Tax=Vitis vinifera TaxID=29760 RepID=A0A438GCT5_VITVI|nr:hypothetical protein CK203_059050 [Vitis vinifera]
MKLKIRDMEAEHDKVAEKDYLDLLDIATEVGISQPIVTSRPSFDFTSVEHSSRPSATGTSVSGYDGSRGEGTNDGSDPGNDEGDVRQNNKVDNHWHLLVKMISHIVLKMKTTTLEEPVQVLEPLESHIEEDNEG